jgi:uncharacterized protein YsxB (DUF464 family)
MIHAEIEREHGTGRIHSFRVEGHALFAPRGKDIVCAGVSAVTVGTVNSIEALCGVELKTRMEEGLLQASVPEDVPEAVQPSLQLLLESMVVMLQTIETSYGKYIKLTERTE